jgi:type I restriction enzyme S subunit
MRCEASGTILASISSNLLETIIVPALPVETRAEIASLVDGCHSARHRGKHLLERARSAVELAVEQGQDEATRYLEKSIPSSLTDN